MREEYSEEYSEGIYEEEWKDNTEEYKSE